MSPDRIPGTNLYIGGLFTLRRKEALRKANITHVLSALRLPLDQDLFKNYEHHVVELDDVEDENIIQHFQSSNEFIQKGLDGDGGVLVHCAMGKSRSAALIIAYLLFSSTSTSTTATTMPPPHTPDNAPAPHTPNTALALIRQSRPFAEPNPGFMHQLHLYHRMHCPADLDAEPRYQRWCYTRCVEEAKRLGSAPDFGGAEGGMKFRDELSPRVDAGGTDGGGGLIMYRCRRCRQQLASTPDLGEHVPRAPTTSKSFAPAASSSASPAYDQQQQQPCAHLFLDQPLSWMRGELEQGKLEGRLECPNAKCRTQVGRYAWQGLKCSCGGWVCPGICLGVGKVDAVRDTGAMKGGSGDGGGGGDVGNQGLKDPREKI